MKPLLAAFLAVITIGCADTRVSINGHEVLRTQADCSYLEFHQGNTSLVMKDVSHSNPTRAGGSVVGTLGTAVAGGILAAGSHGLLH